MAPFPDTTDYHQFQLTSYRLFCERHSFKMIEMKLYNELCCNREKNILELSRSEILE